MRCMTSAGIVAESIMANLATKVRSRISMTVEQFLKVTPLLSRVLVEFIAGRPACKARSCTHQNDPMS